MRTLLLVIPAVAWLLLAVTQLVRSFGPRGSRRRAGDQAAQEALARLHTGVQRHPAP